MPQIWMTYDELAALLGCGVADVKLWVNRLSLDRRKSRSGTTRIKLNSVLTAKFFEMVKQTDFDLESAIDGLYQVHFRMAQLLKQDESATTQRSTLSDALITR